MGIDNARGMLAVKKLKKHGVAEEFANKCGVVSLGRGVENNHETAMTAFFAKGSIKSLHHTLGDIVLNKGLHKSNAIVNGVER